MRTTMWIVDTDQCVCLSILKMENRWLTNIDQLKENVNFALCKNLLFWIHQKEKTESLSAIEVKYVYICGTLCKITLSLIFCFA